MQNGPHYLGHRKRLRDRLQRDPGQLADYEVLELLLTYVLPRRDTKALAKELLARFGDLRGVLAADPGELRTVEGLGPAVAAFWTLLRETRARYGETQVRNRLHLTSPQAVADMAMSRLGDCRSEEFWIALVDNKNRLMAWERVTRGTVDQTAVYPREVLALALERKAGGIILVHNHPGGDPNPSSQDVELTRLIARSARDLGIRVLDHLIVTEQDYFSFQSNGML